MPSVSRPSVDTERKDAHVELYPTVGRRIPGDQAWEIAVHGRVVRPWLDNIQRRLVLRLLRRTMRVSVDQMQSPLFADRLTDFWIKPCRGRRVSVNIEGSLYALSKRSRGSGHFNSNLRLTFASAGQSDAKAGRVILSAAEAGNVDPSATAAQLIPQCGTSVISDIDDTIKVSNVFDRRQMFASAFLHPYLPVEGMSERYRDWSEQGCQFHYVSSSPWQLFRPLESFMNEHGFPAGSFHLRTFRLRDPNNFQLKLAGTRSKRKAIRNLLKWYPFRQFVLIGDGGEKDARLYAKVARKHGHQIAQICIRKLPHQAAESERTVRDAMRQLPRTKWRMFEHGSELNDLQAGSELGWSMNSTPRS